LDMWSTLSNEPHISAGDSGHMHLAVDQATDLLPQRMLKCI